MSETYRLKGVLQSDDGGKTWWVYRMDYLSQAKHGTDATEFSFVKDHVKPEFETMSLERIVEESRNLNSLSFFSRARCVNA